MGGGKRGSLAGRARRGDGVVQGRRTRAEGPRDSAAAQRAVQEWAAHAQECRMKRVVARSSRLLLRNLPAERMLRRSVDAWAMATVGRSLAQTHAMRQLLSRVLPDRRRRTASQVLRVLQKDASLRRARRLLVSVQIANRTREMLADVLRSWLQECVVSKRSHPVEKQQRALPRKEFDGWMVVAERATNRFAHLLFVLTCWRNLVSQRRGESRSMAMHREEVAPRAERGFRMRLSGSETGDGDGWSGSGASGHDGPSEKDDLPGMSDTGESDAELAENCDRSWIQALDEAVRRRKMQESRQQCRAQRGETLFHMHSALLCRQSEGEGKRGRRNVLSRTKSQGNKMSLTETLSALLVAEESAKLLDQQGVRVSGASASSQSRARGAGRESVEPVIREQRRRQLEQKRSGHLDSELLTSHLEAIDGGCADGQSHRAEYFDWGVERGSFSQWQAPFATTPREDHTLHLSRHHLQLSAPAPDVECRRWVGVQGEEGMRHVPRAGAISGSGCGGGPGRAASDSRGPSSLSARSTEVSETKRYPLSERYTPLERYFSSKECCKESPPAILGIWESPEQAATAFGRKDQEGSGSEGAVPLDEFVSSLARLSRASRDTTGSPLKWQ